MKCTIPEISWHNREPVLSLDINPISDNFYKLATGGADCHVLIWQLNICDNGAVKVETLSDLTRHQRAINSVRWSPSGQYLASADDDANIIVWQMKTDNIPLLEGETTDKETWILKIIMRGHKEDIYDLCWSPNNLKLLSGSVDNTAILWDFAKGKSEQILTDHKGFVQGVSWDPKNQFFATISTDRICRIYESTGKQVKARIHKGVLPVHPDHYLHNKEVKFFHDDTFKSFFRRLDFSPEGTLLAVPSGHIQIEDCKTTLNATYLFVVDSWSSPVAVLPARKECSTVVRFCPLLFELQEDGPEATVLLPYRMILAVGTDHDVILYDTQQVEPFAYFRDIHYTRLTDLTWSRDGQLLIASSTDGFCALITFEPNELGIQYTKEDSEVEESLLEVSGCEELDKDLDVSVNDEAATPKVKKASFLEKWTIKTPKPKEIEENTIKLNKTTVRQVESIQTKTVDKPNGNPIIKRIKPIAVNEIENQSGAKLIEVRRKPKEPEPVKATSLLSFLKSTPKKTNQSENTSKNEFPGVILDEIEARDSWRCEEDQTGDEKNSLKEIQPAIMDTDDYTEDFSLHLDDTVEASVPERSLKDEGNALMTESSKEKVLKHDCTESKERIAPPLDKITTTTKRRIPLITLSSPKQRKK